MAVKVYTYQSGRDFHMPPRTRRFYDEPAGDRLSPLATEGKDYGRVIRRLEQVHDPAEADFFVFPYNLGYLTDMADPLATADFVSSLPWFDQAPERHVIFDQADCHLPLPLPCQIFKTSMARSLKTPNIHVLPYDVNPHVGECRPVFDQARIRYDTMFMGALSNNRRIHLIQALKQEKRLRWFFRFPTPQKTADGAVFHVEVAPEQARQMRAEFLDKISRSLTVLCPAGLGRNTVRFFEAMYLGRVPVLVSDDCALPLDKEIDYPDFSFTIPEDAIPHAQELLHAFIRRHGPETLLHMGTIACRTWHRHFARTRAALMVDVLERVLALDAPAAGNQACRAGAGTGD
jgi:hypothetical protein